ncbi:MAG: alpha/beta hydrolase family protein [Rubrivivax sp.]
MSSRGGRPDLAAAALPTVTAPTLMIVGGADLDVLDLNAQAIARMRAPVRLKIIPGATHLFEKPGTLDRVALLAAQWFCDHVPARPAAQPTAPVSARPCVPGAQALRGEALEMRQRDERRRWPRPVTKVPARAAGAARPARPGTPDAVRGKPAGFRAGR